MVTGASTAEVAVVLIDARYGVVQQSRRHAYLSALLGIRHIVGCVMTWVAYGRDAAEEYWNQKPAEEAPKKPTPADHKPPAKKAASRASSATKTSRRSSGNPAKRAATAGSKSTTTGRSSKRTSTSSTG